MPAARSIGILAGRTLALTAALALASAGSPVRAGAPEVPRDEPVEAVQGPIEVESPSLPSELVAPPVAALAEALRLAAALRFPEAARIFEAQWQSTGDPRFLFHAAVARSRAGHHALALRHLSQCLAIFERGGQLSEAARRHLEEAREREVAATIGVRLRLVESTESGSRPLSAQALAGARIVLSAASPSGEHVPGNSFEIVGAPLGELRLDPGVWVAQVEISGHVPVVVERSIAEAGGDWEIGAPGRAIAVEFRFTPERALRRARMRLSATDDSARPPIEAELVTSTTTVTLTPGPWRLGVRARSYGADLDLNIEPGQRPIDVALHKYGADEPGRLGDDSKLLLGLLGSFAGAFLAGTGLILGGTNLEGKADKRDAAARAQAGVDPTLPGPIDPATEAAIEAAYPTARFHQDLGVARGLHTSGIVIAMIGVGAAGAAVPVAFRARRRAAIVELAVGAAALGGGASWLGWSLGQNAKLLADSQERGTPKGLERGEGHRIAASMFVGLGLGLVFFSSVVLARHAGQQRKRARAFTAAPMAGPGLAGLSLRGRF